MNKPVLFIRIAAVLTLVHAVLHTIGGVFGKVEPGPASVAVAAMKTNEFLLMGHVRSFWMFYRGMGLAMTIGMTAEAIVLWQLASLAKTHPERLRPILTTFAVAYGVLAVNSNTFFFVGPVIAEIVIVAFLGMAIVTAKSEVPAYAVTSQRA